MRPLRVVTLLDGLFEAGGAERMAALLTLELDRERVRPYVCTTRYWPTPAFTEELAHAGIPVWRLDRRHGKIDVLPWRRLHSLLRRERIDVVHAHKFGSNIWGTIVGRAAGVPVIVAHEHSWPFAGQPLRRFLDRELIARFASVVVAVSEEDKRLMREVEGIDPARVRVIPNGIPELRVSGHDIRAEAGIPAGAPLVGIVSVIRPEKAIPVLVEAVAIARRTLPELRLLVAGGDFRGEEARVRAAIRRHDVGDAVTLLGPRSDIADVLAAIDVAVLCSDREGLPLAVIEYMAAAKPVVATNVGGLPILVEDGVTGVLVPPRDPRALATALLRLADDPALRRRLGERGRERQRREYSLAAAARSFERLYEELAAKAGVRRD